MFLDDAVRACLDETKERMELYPARLLEGKISRIDKPLDFETAIIRRNGKIRIIAEVKRMSPSAGAIRPDVDLDRLVSDYRRGGAAAVSVLTCRYKFGGSLDDLGSVAGAAGIPVLRKDFIVDPYQVLEARAHGASAVLLIAAALPLKKLEELGKYAGELGMTALVEAHGEQDLDRALESGARIIGINNRDLTTLEVDISTTERLLALVPDGKLVVSESGIGGRGDAERMERLGVDALLVGELLMRADDPARRIRELLGEVEERCGSKSAE